MVVVYIANRAIYHALPTALNSLLTNNQRVEKIYLLIEDDSIKFINHPKIKFININDMDFIIRDKINCTPRFPYTAMVRCVLPKILHEDKVIYLDVDTIVDADISELWDLHLGGNCIAAREEAYKYWNSGVLVMNLKLIKALKADDKLVNLLQRCKFKFPDQDAMNLIFRNSVEFIPSHYNALGKDAYGGRISIRHFAGLIKPWKDNAAEEDKAFWKKYEKYEIDGSE